MKKHLHFKNLLQAVMLVVCLGLGQLGFGQLLVEDFTGTNTGNLGTQNSWVPNGSGTDVQVANVSPLTYTNYNSVAGNYVTLSNVNGLDPHKLFASSISTASASVFYYSFLINVSNGSATSDYCISLRNSANTSYLGRVFINKNASNNLKFGISVGSSTVSSIDALNYNLNETYLVVLRYDIGTTNDSMYLWVNPSMSSEPLTSNANASHTSVAKPGYGTVINSLMIHQRTTSGPVCKLDSFRVSNGSSSSTAWSSLGAAPITWNGTTSNSWLEPNNWTPNTVPTGAEDVLINTVTTNAPNLDTNFTLATGKTLTVSGTGTLTINPANTLTIAGTAAFNDKDIVLKSDATGTASIGQVTGTITGATNVTVERYIQGRRAFRFITPAVTTTTSIFQNWQANGGSTFGIGTQITGSGNGFDVSNANNPSLHTYDAQAPGTTTGFTAATNTNVATLKAGVGYRLLVRGDRNVVLSNPSIEDMNNPTTLSSKGTLTTGSVTFDSSVGSPAPVNNTTNTQTNGYTLIGNPYASPVDWHSVTKTGVNNNAYYTWDPTLGTTAQRGRYVVYTQIDATTGSSSIYNPSIGTDLVSDRRYLQSGQAVFIKNATLGTPATLIFKEIDKANSYSYVFRSSSNAVTSTANSALYLTVYEPNELALGGSAIDGALALFGSDFSNALNGQDVDKLASSGENIAFVRENKNLAIETVAPVAVNDELFVKTIQFQANKSYTFKVNTQNFDTSVTAKMVDLYLNTQTQIDLTQPSFVTFTTTADVNSYGAERFKIVFTDSALGNGNFTASNIAVYPNPIVNNQFTIAVPSSVSGKVTVAMTNMLGQVVYSASSEAASTMLIQPKQQLEEGVYIVSITNNGQVLQSKVVVRK